MTRDPLIRAWIWLLAFSAGSTALAVAVPGLAGAAPMAAILVLAWAKARIILSDYLGLRAAPFWRRGFGMVLAFYMAGLLVLYFATAR